MTFQPSSVRSFRFESVRYDEARATAELRYALDPGPEFVERIHFPGAPTTLAPDQRAALERSLRLVFLAAGVSYYKAAAPPLLVVEPFGLGPASAGFFGELYRQGLGEMAHENGLDLSGLRFPVDPAAVPDPVPLALPRRTAVALGGGKDSIVALELLARAGEPMLMISVNSHGPVRDVVEVARARHPQLAYAEVQRTIAPELLALNDRGALNGHIPISAVLAFVLAAAGVLHGFDAVAVGNERSANVGSLVGGREVNHQWSKSFVAERGIADRIRAEAVPGFLYFSALRPLSELAIARVFAGLGDYHGAFLSCNAAFRLRGARDRWCAACPKCRFVFLALAPFLEKQRLIAIFDGRNLLAEPDQEAGFRALAGLGAPKPFECVGEILESAAAFERLLAHEDWREEAVVRALADDIQAFVAGRRHEIDAWSRPSDEHAVPERVLGPILATG